jgi:hypothetical protein
MLTRSSAIGNMDDVRLQYGTCNTVSLLEQVKAVQQQHFLPLQLVTVVSGHSHLQSLAERHSQEAASQLSHHLYLQLVTMESNVDLIRSSTLGPEGKLTLCK